MKKKWLPTVTALTATAVLVGVTIGAYRVTATTPRHAARATAPNVITMTDWQFPDGCNLVAASSAADAEVCQNQDGLFALDNHLNYFPDLNLNIPTIQNGEVKIVNGNMQVTYTLKPNLRWSDGSPLTVDDLIFGVKLNLAAGNSTGIDQIQSMRKVNARTVVFTYKGIYAPFVAYGWANPYPQAFFQRKYGSTDVKTIATKWLTDPYNSPKDVFSGPYMIQSWTNGQSIVQVPNPYYTALPAAKGHPRPAQFKFVSLSGDESTLAQDLQSSNAGIDQAEDFQFTDLPTLNASKYHVTALPALFVEHLELNQNGVLKDVRLRQALQYAIDKATLFHELFPQVPTNQINTFMLNSVLPNTSPWVDKSLPLSTYDPNKAKALLKAAGYSTDYFGSGPHLTLNFATTTAAVRQKDYQILAKDWAAIGIHLNPRFTTAYGNNGLFETWANNGVLIHGRFDIALFAYTESPDPQQSESNFNPALIPTAAVGHHSGGDQNDAHVTDMDQFNLLVKARHTLDQGQRHAIFNQWQKLVNQRAYWIMLYARPNIAANNGLIGNYKPNPSQATNEWNAFQWYKVGAS